MDDNTMTQSAVALNGRFQGTDRDLVVLSFCHCPSDSKMGEIVRDRRRINVALTRSKCKLILIASATALRSSKTPILEKLIAFLAEKDWIVDAETERARR